MTTYYCNAAATGANDGTSETDAWTDWASAFSTVAAGDHVYMKGGTDYTTVAQMTTPGTSSAAIIFEGYTSTPGDGGRALIDGTNICLYGGQDYYVFRNLDFVNVTQQGINSAGTDYSIFENCKFDNCGLDGCTIGTFCTFVNCQFSNNGSEGLSAGSGTVIVGCVFFGNTDSACITTNSTILYKNLSYAPGSTANEHFKTYIARIPLVGNTIDGDNETANGIVSAQSQLYCFDNLIYDCGTAITTSTAVNHGIGWTGYNLMNSNTANYNDTGSAPNLGRFDVSGAPAFTDEANDDYTLGASSPAIDAGMTPGLRN